MWYFPVTCKIDIDFLSTRYSDVSHLISELDIQRGQKKGDHVVSSNKVPNCQSDDNVHLQTAALHIRRRPPRDQTERHIVHDNDISLTTRQKSQGDSSDDLKDRVGKAHAKELSWSDLRKKTILIYQSVWFQLDSKYDLSRQYYKSLTLSRNQILWKSNKYKISRIQNWHHVYDSLFEHNTCHIKVKESSKYYVMTPTRRNTVTLRERHDTFFCTVGRAEKD